MSYYFNNYFILQLFEADQAVWLLAFTALFSLFPAWWQFPPKTAILKYDRIALILS